MQRRRRDRKIVELVGATRPKTLRVETKEVPTKASHYKYTNIVTESICKVVHRI